MNTFYYTDFPALLSLLRHLPDVNFQLEFFDERLCRRHGELNKISTSCPILEAAKGIISVPMGSRERGARPVAQGSSRTVAPVVMDALVGLRAHLWGSRTVWDRVSYTCPIALGWLFVCWSHMAALGPDHHVIV